MCETKTRPIKVQPGPALFLLVSLQVGFDEVNAMLLGEEATDCDYQQPQSKAK